ncbi:MAG: hypothetical protein P8Y63_00965 [Deltaproteobacteria bacterium]|jgi:hypothetical protein
MSVDGRQPRILLIFFSFSGQTAALIGRLAGGLQEAGTQVVVERLRPVRPLSFPLGGVLATVRLMITTAFRQRLPIRKLSERCRQPFDLIILAGPTWSYNPSGPVLSLLDRDRDLFRGQTVLPLISCRGYWRLHWLGLRRKLSRRGARTPNLVVFTHPHPEPWRTIGVFLKIAGKNPEKTSLLGHHYRSFGHSQEQRQEAHRFGVIIGRALQENTSLADLDFRTKAAGFPQR